MAQIIALITDFGAKGQHYVASMKAVILQINPHANIIDISHEISSYSIIETSYLIKSTYKYFPKNTVFIIVVDPGVGSSREILALKTESNFYFVGPNNGIFSGVLESDRITECFSVINDEYFNKPVSNTFHGRDIMSPVGAFISKGTSLDNFGYQFDLNNLIKQILKYEVLEKKKQIICMIQYVDSFGNGTTNIPILNERVRDTSIELREGSEITIKIKNKEFNGIYTSHFANVNTNSLLFLKGSSGYLEISINQGNAAEMIGFNVGDNITFILK